MEVLLCDGTIFCDYYVGVAPSRMFGCIVLYGIPVI